MSKQRGFSLLEMTVAVAIAALLSIVIVRASTSALHAFAQQGIRTSETATIGELTDRLRQEEDTAWAIFTPPNDVLGASNADGHELDFFVRDNKHQSYFWAYTYNGSSHVLQRYTYMAPGGSAALDRSWNGITAFVAHTYPLTALQDSTTPLFSSLYENATLQNGGVQFYSAAAPWIEGGNSITYVLFQTASNVRELHLSTQTAPSGFTIVLNYTPAPSPSSTPSALNAWPQFVELPVDGSAISASSLPVCATNQARAFTDATFSAPLSSASPPASALPAGVSGYTDSNGCVTINDAIGSNTYLYEAGNTGVLKDFSNSCGANIQIVSALPGSESGPTVGLQAAGAAPSPACAMYWQDSHVNPSQVAVSYEVAGCTNVAQTSYTLIGVGTECNAGTQWQSNWPDCTPGGSGGIYYGSMGVTTSGPGTASDNGDGTINMERTGNGNISAVLAFYELVCDWATHGIKRYNYSYSFSFQD